MKSNVKIWEHQRRSRVIALQVVKSRACDLVVLELTQTIPLFILTSTRPGHWEIHPKSFIEVIGLRR